MKRRMRKSGPLILTLLLSAAIGAEHLARPRAGDAAPFHARVRQAAEKIPRTLPGGWVSDEDMKLDEAAIALLQPNSTLQRLYKNPESGMSFILLLVQCRTARDMGGHYPPVCYRGKGYDPVGSASGTRFQCHVGARTIAGVDYSFNKYFAGRSENIVVRNLIIMPDGRFAQDIQQVRSAAADYLRQYYGAAQIQLVFNADNVPASERDAIFSSLMNEVQPLLDALTSGGKQ